MRGNSDASRMSNMKGKDELFYYLGIQARLSDSLDSSDGSLEAGRARESLSSYGGSSPTPLLCAHTAARTSHRPTAYCNWMKSSVTTEIGTGDRENQQDPNKNLSTTAIQVQRDVVMH